MFLDPVAFTAAVIPWCSDPCNGRAFRSSMYQGMKNGDPSASLMDVYAIENKVDILLCVESLIDKTIELSKMIRRKKPGAPQYMACIRCNNWTKWFILARIFAESKI